MSWTSAWTPPTRVLAGSAALEEGVSDRGGIGKSASTDAVAPSVTHQGQANYCASYGLASALRFCGYVDHADHLECKAEEVLAATTNQAAKAVDVLVAFGGWAETKELTNFDPLAERSPHPTIVQVCASDGDNTHIVALAGDWIFDSNLHSALPLSKESLDACCLGLAAFSHASYSVRLVPGKKLKRKRACLDGSSNVVRS